MSNFSFIPQPFQALFKTASEAEKEIYRAPLYAAMLCRKSLEEWVRWLYTNDANLELPYDSALNDLLHTPGFKQLVAGQYGRLNLIRRLGNDAVHSQSKIATSEVLHAVKLLHGFVGWVVQGYSETRVSIPPFNEGLVPIESEAEKTKIQLQELEARYQAALEKLEKAENSVQQYATPLPPPIDPNEDLTRKMYIDLVVQEAGWDPKGQNVFEFPVIGMPRQSGHQSTADGNGRVDYVLWGKDGKPLALIEAKRTSRSKEEGQHQAFLYANCLENMYGQRPIIYCSNGFETMMWDDVSYPQRSVFGLYTEGQLQTIINRRASRQKLQDQTVNESIADRYYQKEAIAAVNEVFENQQRSALLVMATGTGKTRTAAALIELLSKAGWVKRVLFLADRVALVHQAKTNLNTYLPQLPAVDLTKEKEVESSRIVFSTYQTLNNLIDGEYDGQSRHFGVGYFDLIIFDEIHRSVYNKYRHIFNYFDGLKVGLTATPRDQGDKDTYGLFQLQPNNPTFAYELDQAVKDQYLVPYHHLPVPTKFQREGINYATLSEAEKLEYEEKFADPLTGLWPDEIESEALNQWLFNTDTVDKILAFVMERGIKVEGGDKLGKTIVFARSHNHAVFIQERFNIQFPEYRGHFLDIIDYQQEYKYDSLNHFKDASRMPQIALSVDMLDTGIDIPEVVNLVFFKPIRSSTKFWQMIGRGTRLCIDLFGPEDHKSHFLIFDCCANFEFFSARPGGLEPTASKSLSQRLFEIRLRLALLLRNEQEQELKEYAETLVGFLYKQTQELKNEHFIVRQHWEFVEKYKDLNSWNGLTELDVHDLFTHIGPLIVEKDQDEMAKRFDAMMLEMQHYLLLGDDRQIRISEKVMEIARRLSKKATIPSIGNKLPVLTEIQSATYWANTNILGLEKLRKDLRDLMKFLDGPEKKQVYTTFEDEIIVAAGSETPYLKPLNLEAYRRKIEQFFRENENHLTIRRIRSNQVITQAELDELERMLFAQGNFSKEEVVAAIEHQPLTRFIRSILGLEIQAAKALFSEFLDEHRFNTKQIRFINTIIDSLVENGIVEPSRLFEAPYTDIDSGSVLALFSETESGKIIKLLREMEYSLVVA